MSRIFRNVKEAYAEIERELLEMGLDYQTETYQDQHVGDDPGFLTKELQGYNFIIEAPDPDDSIKVIQTRDKSIVPWIETEAQERFSGLSHNPGKAWKERPLVWEQFIEPTSSRFSYTYSERMYWQLWPSINELKVRPNTRQAVIEIHQSALDIFSLGGKRRIPCSLSYSFLIRRHALDCFYVMRSSDYYTHFLNDVVLAILLQDFIRHNVNPDLKMGRFHMFVVSLHAFAKDLKARGVF